MSTDSNAYLDRKKQYQQLLTIYGRKPVLEALQTPGVKAMRLHLAESNKPAKILSDIISLAKSNKAEILYHDRKALSFISKNQKQDQGVAVDLKLSGYQELDSYIEEMHQTKTQQRELIALDNVTNPQNLGMIIRSVCASNIDGLLVPRKGCAKLDSLVIKASAGTLFKAKIIRCEDLSEALKRLKQSNAKVVGLDASAPSTLGELSDDGARVFVLGNESEGLSKETKDLCDNFVKIPMFNQVESLNVAVTASLIAFRNLLH